MEDDFPVGTKVIVYRIDGKTIAGEGAIEAWLPFSEIPDEDEEILANTHRVGTQVEVSFEDVVVSHEDGSEQPLEEALEETTNLIPKIRLRSGEVTYGCCCYWRSLSEHQESENN